MKMESCHFVTILPISMPIGAWRGVLSFSRLPIREKESIHGEWTEKQNERKGSVTSARFTSSG